MVSVLDSKDLHVTDYAAIVGLFAVNYLTLFKIRAISTETEDESAVLSDGGCNFLIE